MLNKYICTEQLYHFPELLYFHQELDFQNRVLQEQLKRWLGDLIPEFFVTPFMFLRNLYFFKIFPAGSFVR